MAPCQLQQRGLPACLACGRVRPAFKGSIASSDVPAPSPHLRLCVPHTRTLVNTHRVTQISRRLTHLRTLDLNTFAIKGHRIQGLGVDVLEATILPLPGEGNGHPLQYSHLENPTDREARLGSQRVGRN